jgi:hypothetical protein
MGEPDPTELSQANEKKPDESSINLINLEESIIDVIEKSNENFIEDLAQAFELNLDEKRKSEEKNYLDKDDEDDVADFYEHFSTKKDRQDILPMCASTGGDQGFDEEREDFPEQHRRKSFDKNNVPDKSPQQQTSKGISLENWKKTLNSSCCNSSSSPSTLSPSSSQNSSKFSPGSLSTVNKKLDIEQMFITDANPRKNSAGKARLKGFNDLKVRKICFIERFFQKIIFFSQVPASPPSNLDLDASLLDPISSLNNFNSNTTNSTFNRLADVVTNGDNNNKNNNLKSKLQHKAPISSSLSNKTTCSSDGPGSSNQLDKNPKIAGCLEKWYRELKKQVLVINLFCCYFFQ